MNTPSVKTLSGIFGDKAKEAKRILTCKTSEIQYPAVIVMRKACFNPPSKYLVRLVALDELGEFHGVECCETVDGEFAEYLNSGDTYANTLIYWRGRYRVSSVGDFIETMERSGVNFK